MNAERTLKFEGTDNTGAVIFASPVAGVFYRAWYSILVFDRLLHRTVPGKPVTSLLPAIDPWFWRLEVPVPAGQFAETVRENLLQDINRMQFTRAKPEDLEAARKEALEYLNSPFVRGWFASLGIEAHRQEGLQWVQSFTPDDMRATARDLVIMNRLIAEWSPKPAQNVVRIESLNSSGNTAALAGPAAKSAPLPPIHLEPLANHPARPKNFAAPERLASGVWLAVSSVPKVFVSGGETADSNGAFWDLNPDTMRTVQKYRPDRILVLAPSASLNNVRTTWSAFKGNERDATVITPLGKVANIDLPALIVLKAALDRKLIESGWWRDASLRIDAARGAALQIEGPAEIRDKVQEWIKEIAAAPLSEADFAWAREAAANHLDDVLPDVQALIWQRVPDYILPDVNTIAATQVQDIAKLYF
jgi:hypothetical protein